MKSSSPLLASAFVALAFALATPAVSQKPSHYIEAEDLLRPPRIFSVGLAPDGKHLAGLAPIGKGSEQGIVIIDAERMAIARSFNWQPGFDIYDYDWVDNENIVFNVGKWKSYAAGMFSVNVNRKSIYPLIDTDAVARIIHPMTDDPRHSWVWIRDGWEVKPALAKLAKTGSAYVRDVAERSVARTNSNHLITDRIAQPDGDVYHWYVDWDYEPRIVSRFNVPDKKLEYLHRNNSTESWTALDLDPEQWQILHFTGDNRSLYVAGYNGQQTKGLFTYNIDAGELSEELFRDPYYDFSESVRLRFIKSSRQLIGLTYDRDTLAQYWFAKEMEAIQQVIDATLTNRSNVIYDWSDDFRMMLIYSYSDTTPPEYALLDLSKRSLVEVSKSAPWLDYEKLAPTTVEYFETSDGLKLEGYLTLPKEGQAPYPMVCLVHGGPWARDYSGYDAETQFLANRGYAVLRVNFRGSTGYGRRISADFEYDFRRMHQDITESVRAMVARGVADPDRLAIMGHSFGGYAALCGAAFEPDLYKAAVTSMGVFSWEELIKDRKRQRSRYAYHRLVTELGDPRTAEDRFHDISPIRHVDQIKIPIFISHGKSDKNVSVRQSRELESALKKNRVEHETLYLAGEGHSLFGLKNRLRFYEQSVAFLDKHLK